MRPSRPCASYDDVVEAYSAEDPQRLVKYGLGPEVFIRMRRYGLATPIAQYYGIVQDGLRDAVHLFRGLNRPLLSSGDMRADESILIYSWRPQCDFVWSGSPPNGLPNEMSAPPHHVFVVLIASNAGRKSEEANIRGSIQH